MNTSNQVIVVEQLDGQSADERNFMRLVGDHFAAAWRATREAAYAARTFITTNIAFCISLTIACFLTAILALAAVGVATITATGLLGGWGAAALLAAGAAAAGACAWALRPKK